jgi:hypothetical protein
MGATARAIECVSGGLALTVCLMLVTVPLAFSLLASAVLVCLLSLAKERYAVALVSAAPVLTFGLLELGLRVIPSDASPHYYRPHELLAGGQVADELVNYKPNESVEGFRMQAGDLAVISGNESIAQSRTVDFYTDSLGFRNREDYAGQALVLFGDSFVVGNGNSQDETLSEVLTNDYQLPAYNAGYPDGIDGYAQRFKLLQQIHGTDFRGIVVVFEGNDFPCSAKRSGPPLFWNAEQRAGSRAGATNYIPQAIRELESYRLIFGLTRRAARREWTQEQIAAAVQVEEYGGRDVAFLAGHVQQTKQATVCAWGRQRGFFRSIADQVALVVFVPTKYRVYKSLPEAGVEAPPASPAATFTAELARNLSFPYLDLTPALVSASERLLEDGKYTFWRDDTHWNENGIRVAADAIVDHLRKEELLPAEP